MHELLREWHPLDHTPAPEYVPPSWDGPHVGKRLAEALRTLSHVPVNGYPAGFMNSWPAIMHEYADRAAYEDDPKYANMGVMTRGHIWVKAAATVAAGDALYYNTTTGLFSGSNGAFATGSVTFTSQPVADSTLTLNGTAITFKASGAVAASNQVNIGATLGDTLVDLAALINANPASDDGIGACKAEAYPPSPGGAGQGSGAYILNVIEPARSRVSSLLRCSIGSLRRSWPFSSIRSKVTNVTT